MKKNIVIPLLAFGLCGVMQPVFSQTKTENDGNWSKQSVARQSTAEAEYMIRVGDIDNLGHGFDEGFNPFSGDATGTHSFPWLIDPLDVKGTDCILLGIFKFWNCYFSFKFNSFFNDIDCFLS